MVYIRALAVFLLVLTLLPWGAYSPVNAAALPVIHAKSIAATDLCLGGDMVGANQVEPRTANSPHHCRTAVLVGSPCGPDLALLGNATAPNLTRAHSVRFRITTARLVGVPPTAALDPPISC